MLNSINCTLICTHVTMNSSIKQAEISRKEKGLDISRNMIVQHINASLRNVLNNYKTTERGW